MIKKVVFFNTWQLGDLHSNKEYVRQFAKSFLEHKVEVIYLTGHPCSATNLPYEHGTLKEHSPFLLTNPKSFFHEETGTVYINTWVGHYLTAATHNFVSQKFMWSDIAQLVRESSDGLIDVQISSDTLTYVSEIDRDLVPVTDYRPSSKTVLVCNEKATSGQSEMTNLFSVVDRLSLENPEIEFLCTRRLDIDRSNVKFTDDFTSRASSGCDLPEISLLSEFCRVIVTNSSGPGTFTMTKNNFLDPNKTIVAFCTWEGNTFWHGVQETKAQTHWYNTFDEQKIYTILKKVLEEI